MLNEDKGIILLPLSPPPKKMIFIDLEKAYNRVPREAMWGFLEKKVVPLKNIKLIKDIYEKDVTRVKTSVSITSEFPITIVYIGLIKDQH